MRNPVYFLLVSFTVLSSQAQNVKYGGWNEQIVVGATVSLNSTWIFNSAVQSLDEGISDQKFSFGYNVGGSFEYRFNELIAVGLDLQYFALSQKYDGAISTQSQFWESSVSLGGLNIPIYAKIMSKGGAFVEIGWQFGIIMASKFNRTSNAGGSIESNKDVSDSFSGAIFSPHLGFGFDFPVNDAVMITAGIRANYGINDVKGVDGLGNPVAEYPNTNPGTPISPADTQAGPSNVLTAGLFIGARYMFDAGGRY